MHMAEISIPSKDDVKGAIIYETLNIQGRNFVGQETPVLVYFMPDTVTVPGYKPYTDAADPTLASINASYVGIDPSKYQAILDNVFGPWARQGKSGVRFQLQSFQQSVKFIAPGGH